MEKSFDFGRLLKIHEKKHKSKPAQFSSVAGGVKKRLETKNKQRKSSRLTAFDNLRDIPKCESPVSKAKSKIEHRRQQLEIWKKEKEKQKQEAAAKKKKPFVAGVPHAPLKFVPPPPPPKLVPSTSGRVTRSQNSKINKTTTDFTTSFAPKNASFKPPEIKNIKKLPSLAPPKSKNAKKQNISFDPVIPSQRETRQTRSRITKTTEESKPKATEKTKGKITKVNTKLNTKLNKIQKSPLKSSSSSEIEQNIKLSPILTSKTSRKSLPAPNSPLLVKKTPRKSIQASKNVTPKNPVPKSESSSEERLRSPKSSSECSMTPEQIAEEASKMSPCVTMSRGKDNARKEMKKKLNEGLLDEDASNMESVDHFRKQLASEIKRITEMCDTWDKIFEQTVLPETVQEAVLAAVGQARLLMSQKMQQFAALVEACARPAPGSALVTPADLHGFWDMVFMQVENVDMRFKKLEELRSRGWVAEQVVEVKKKVVKPVVKKTNKPAVPSKLRDMIAAARKAKKEQEVPSVVPPEEEKTFDAGFFSVRSPLRSPLPSPRTPGGKHCLLKAVLSSEAKKASASKNSASFAMLRASVLSKNYECDGIAPIPQTPITPVNIYATPGRSILKTNTDQKSKKSIKVVLFDKSDAEVKDSSYLTPDSGTDLHVTPELNTDSGLSSMDLEKVENKENLTKKSKLVRQNAEERSPVLTRSRRRSMNEEGVTPRRSARKKVVQDIQESEDLDEKTPKRSSRRRKSGLQVQN